MLPMELDLFLLNGKTSGVRGSEMEFELFLKYVYKIMNQSDLKRDAEIGKLCGSIL